MKTVEQVLQKDFLHIHTTRSEFTKQFINALKKYGKACKLPDKEVPQVADDYEIQFAAGDILVQVYYTKCRKRGHIFITEIDADIL